MALIGDSDTASAHPFLRRMVEYFEAHGEVHSAALHGEAPASGRRVAARAAEEARAAAQAAQAAQREAELEQRLSRMIRGFVSDAGASSLALPASLSSYERMLAHRLAEELGLAHTSVGEGKERYLTLLKRDAVLPQLPPPAQPCAAAEATLPEAPMGAAAAATTGAPVVVAQSPATAEPLHAPPGVGPTSAPAEGLSASHGEPRPVPVPPHSSSTLISPSAPSPPPAHSPLAQQELATRIRANFARLTASGVPSNVAAVQALQQARQELAAAADAPGAVAALGVSPPSTDTTGGEAIDLAISRLRERAPSAATAQGALEMAARLLSNVLAHPDDPKYRHVKPSNPKLHESLFAHAGGRDLLLAAGFKDVEIAICDPPTAAPSTPMGAYELTLPAAACLSRLLRNRDALTAAATAVRQMAKEAEQAAAQQRTNIALQAVHAERLAREEEAAAAEAEAMRALRREEDERRKAVARAKKDRRKEKRDKQDVACADTDVDDVDAALAALGIASTGGLPGGNGQASSSQAAASALPWGRDREEERRKERLRATLREKIDGGGSHKKAQTKNKK